MSGKPVDGVTIPLLATDAAHAAMQAEVETVAPPVQVTQTQQTTNSRLFTEDEITAARRQEKDKLYPKLTELEQKLALFEEERAEALRTAQEQAAAADAERRRREEDDMSARDLLLRKEDEWKQTLNTAQQEWEQKFNALQAESEARAALLERERQFQEVESYKNRRLAEESANIMPELIDMVGGNTVEEIESSIQALAARTSAIVQNIQQSLPQTQQRPRNISPVGGTPRGPLENATEQQTLTTADIANMSMEQYAQIRDRLLASASGRGR